MRNIACSPASKAILTSHMSSIQVPTIAIATSQGVNCSTQTVLLTREKEMQARLIAIQKRCADLELLTAAPVVPGQLSNGTRGRQGEEKLYELLLAYLPCSISVLDTRAVPHCGDFLLIYRGHDDIITGYAMIDSKNYAGIVPDCEVTKLRYDIDFCTTRFGSAPHWASIVSHKTDISRVREPYGYEHEHGSTIVLLFHSALMTTDMEEGLIDKLLNDAEFYNSVSEFPTISSESSRILAEFERTGTDPLRGRSRVSRYSQRTRTQSQPPRQIPPQLSSLPLPIQGTMPIIPDEREPVESAAVVDSPQVTSQTVLEQRLFKSEKMVPSFSRIAAAMNRLYRFELGSRVRGTQVASTVAQAAFTNPERVSKVLKQILVPGVREGHWLVNVGLIV